jgi:hypothetical protein
MENDKQELMEQMKKFREEAKKQQQEYQQQLEQSIDKVVDILDKVHNQMKANQKLIEMNEFLDQAQQQFIGMPIEQHNESSKDDKKRDEGKKEEWSEED